MLFKKGTNENPTGRPKGLVNTTTKLICDDKTNWGLINNA